MLELQDTADIHLLGGTQRLVDTLEVVAMLSVGHTLAQHRLAGIAVDTVHSPVDCNRNSQGIVVEPVGCSRVFVRLAAARIQAEEDI